jgi:hypothetical protein
VTIESLRKDMQRADDAWHDELVREYGTHAGDARYDWRGSATPTLDVLKEAFLQATREYHIARKEFES